MILSKILKILLTRDLKMISRAKKFCAREKIVRGDPYDFFLARSDPKFWGSVCTRVTKSSDNCVIGQLSQFQ